MGSFGQQNVRFEDEKCVLKRFGRVVKHRISAVCTVNGAEGVTIWVIVERSEVTESVMSVREFKRLAQ